VKFFPNAETLSMVECEWVGVIDIYGVGIGWMLTYGDTSCRCCQDDN
jgi:hypothetical protein